MLNSVNPKETLLNYWGHTSFRPLQEQIINDVLSKKDTLAVLPTGGGKSICYQLPALIMEGTCIVISPLLALINDQIQHLKSKNITAVTIPSHSHTNDIIRIFDNIRIQQLKFLYLSPERLAQPLIQEKLKQLPISFIAVDEAHCISQWGHDFRPSYLKIANLRNVLPDKHILAVTATATYKTQRQIISLLKFKTTTQHIDTVARKNLAYQVFETPNKIELICTMLQKIKAPTIIYVQNRLAVQELSQQLNQKGFNSTYYHAGLTKNVKEKHFNNWYTEQQNIMVATNAFGMGIDKNNVRLVLHLEIPNSLENYLQEAGRAGRDGKKSFSCVILSKNDFVHYKTKHQDVIDAKFVLKVYQNLNQHFQIAFGEIPEQLFDVDLMSFCRKYKLAPKSTEKALRRLDHHQILVFNEQSKAQSIVKFKASQQQVLQFVHQNTNYHTLISYILRNYVGVFDIEKKLDLEKMTTATQLNAIEIHKKLTYLHQIELMDYQPQQHHQTLQFLVPREDKRTLNPIGKQLDQLADVDLEKHQKNLAYFTNEQTCRNTIILNYFDEKSTDDCGICDICISTKKLKNSDVLHQQIVTLLEQKPCTFNQLLIALKINSISLKSIVQDLLQEEKIIFKQHLFQINA